MKTIEINVKGVDDYASAKKAALEAAHRSGMHNAEIIAWHDRSRKMEGPLETCADEGGVCAREFAEHHGADLMVSINEGGYEFFLCDVSTDFSEIDWDEVMNVHADAQRSDFDDLQGG